MEALKMQINPHFLYNTLSNIKYMAMIIHSKTITEAVTGVREYALADVPQQQ